MVKAESYVEEVIILKSQSEDHISSDIDKSLGELGYKWLSGWGVLEDGYASEWVKPLNPPERYPRFHLKVWRAEREGEHLLVTVQLHLDIVQHESPMDEKSTRLCQSEIGRLMSWTASTSS